MRLPVSDLRDRVTAILAWAETCTCDKPADEITRAHRGWCRTSAQGGWLWLVHALLEALDTIDKARELHQPEESPGWITRCVRCQTPWPCDDWQALNGGNE